MIDRHGQKVPMAYAYPVLEWAAKAHRSVTLCVDLAFSFKVFGGIPIFNAPWALGPNLWMFAELGLLDRGYGKKKFGSVQYAVPAKYRQFVGSRINVYPSGYMHRLKAVLGDIHNLAMPGSVESLRFRVNRIRTGASQVLALIRSDPASFCVARFEISLAHTRDIHQAWDDALAIIEEEGLRLDMAIVSLAAIEDVLVLASQ